MKLKRIMAMALCFAMVLSSMSFNVFAATNYLTAADVFPAADADGVITLVEDITLPEDARFSEELKINLNGNALIPTTWNGETIGSVDDFIAFAKATQNGESFSGKTIKLTADIDFEGASYLEIAEDGTVVTDYRIPKFSGTFDGGGHTIKNFNFVVKNTGKHNIMMFSQDNMWAYIKNLNIENVTVNVADISGETRITALTNRVNAGGMTDAAIKNVHVKNFKIESNNTTSDVLRIGGLAYFVQGSQLVMKDCSIDGFEIDANSAQLVGGAVTVVKSKCDFENVDVKNAVFNIDKFGSSGTIGGFVGQTQDQGTGTTFTDCDVEVKMTLGSAESLIGGFVGSIGSVSQFYNCTTEGSITVETGNGVPASIGGFSGDLGWNGMYAPDVQHEFNGCVADVDITAVNANVGGFIGNSTVTGYPKRYMPTYFNNCEAKGDVETTNGAAGGFVGTGDRGIFNDCSAAGNVKGRIAGGFWGEIYPKAEAESTGGWSYQDKVVTHTDPNSKSIVLEGLTVTGTATGTEYQAGLIGFMKDIYVNTDGSLGYGTPVVLEKNSTSEYNRYEYDASTPGPIVTAAMIGENKYTTLEEAFAAAQEGETITLLADVELTENIKISGKTMTLDLGEYTITDKSTSVLTDNDDVWALIELENGANLTIEGNGTIECNYTNVTGGWTGMAYAIDVDNTSKLTVNGGTFINGNGTIQTQGEVTVNGGTFVSHNGGTCIMAIYSKAKVVVNDGTFKDYIDAADVYTGSGAVWSGFGATVEINGGTYNFTADPEHENIVWTLFPAQHAIAGMTGFDTNMTVSGGTFYNFNPETDVITDYSASSGFTFGSVVADGFKVEDLGNGIYGIVEKDPYAISNVAELKAFRDAVNAGNAYSGKTFYLTADIDLSGEDWTPIGNSTNKFQGIFDGQGHTISNLVINMAGKSNVGLFGMTTNGEIKNLTVENALVTGRLNVGVVAGTPYTSKYTNITVTGHVEVNGMAYVGGVGGKNAYANWTDITVNADESSYVKADSVENGVAYRTYVGGVIGFIGEGGHTFKNVTSNINVIGSTVDVGGITGIAHYGNNFVNVSCSGDVTLENADSLADAQEVGGIAGVWNNGGSDVTFENCTYTGSLSSSYTDESGETVTLTSADFVNGGLIGAAYAVDKENSGSLIVDGEQKWPVAASIGNTTYVTLEEAFAAAQEGDTITLLADAAPALTSQRAITKASVIDLGGKTLTLMEDDLYFGTTTFQNGTIVVDPSVKPSTAVFWMFANQTLTFDNVKLVATGVTGTYLIGLDGDNADLNLLNGSEIVIENTTALDLDVICVNASSGNDIVIDNSKVNVTNLDGRVFFRGNYTVSGNSDIDLSGITKAGFRIEAGQTLTISDTATVDIPGEPRDGGIHLTDTTAVYTVADTATVNATVNKPGPVEVTTYEELVAALEQDNANVIMMNDITGAASQSSGYGKAGIVLNAGDVLDGNGKTLTITGANATWDCAIAMKGGEVKNLTIAGAMRGVFMPGANGDVVIDNCVFKDVIYTFNSDGGSKEHTVTIKNTVLNGWTSFSNVHKSVTFEDCSFGEGSGYAFCRPYQATTFTGCEFEEGFEIDAIRAAENSHAFNDCTYAGAPLSADNGDEMFCNGGIVLVDGESVDYNKVYVAQIGETKYETLAEAVAAGGTVTLLTDIDLSSSVTVAKGQTVVLDLNGHTVTGTDTTEKNFGLIQNNGTLTVKDSVGGGALTLTATVNSGWNRYSAVISNNPGGTLVVESGTIKHLGGTDMAYGIDSLTNGTIGGVSVTVDGGTVKSTYRAIRQFLNSDSKQNVLTINGGVVEGDNKAIFFHDPSTKANNGTITIGKGAKVNGGVYLFVTEGSTEWPVEVSIAASALDEAGVTTKNIPEGLEVQEIDGVYGVVEVTYVAKVGNVEYGSMDEAIANWTANSTLTLLADVTLTDVIQLKSTEHHKLDLGSYTMTAAGGKHAIEITCQGQGNATYCLTVNANAENPGGITASGKSCIYYRKSGTTKDRPIITVNNGVFNGSYCINVYSSNSGTNCPQVSITDGIFNGNVNIGKGKLLVSGGTFNGWVNCTGDSTAYRQISGGSFKQWQFMTADAPNKFWVGTSQANYNVGVYVDDNGYLVVGGPVVTAPDEKFEASATYSGWSSYLKYSSAAANGLYYTSAKEALADNKSGTVTVYTDELNLIDSNFKGSICLPAGNDTLVVTFAESADPVWTVMCGENQAVTYSDLVSDGIVTRTYRVITPVAQIGDRKFASLSDAVDAAVAGSIITLLADVTLSETLTFPAGITFNGNGYVVDGSITAGGDLNVAGVTTFKTFNAGYYNHTITIGEGASLKVTGGRMTVSYGNIFNITGTVTDAKTADKSNVIPSLEVTAGLSFNGNGGDVQFNAANAYVVLGDSTTKNSGADGKFNFTTTNSIVEFTKTLKTYEPTVAGLNPAPKFTFKDSIVSFASHLELWGSNTVMNLDNTKLTVGGSFANAGILNVENGAYMLVKAPIMSSHGGNTGTIIIDGATFELVDSNQDWENAGTIKVTADGKLITNDFKCVGEGKIVVDAAGLDEGSATVVDGNGVYSFAGVVTVENGDGVAISYENGDVTLTKLPPVAEINGVGYSSLQAAVDAAAAGDTITLVDDIVLESTVRVSADKIITIDLKGMTVSYDSDVAGEAMITNKGDLAITDSSEAKNGQIIFTYTGAADSNYGKGNYTISNGGTLTLEAGTVANDTAAMSHACYAVDNNSINSEAALTINGGKVVNENNYAIRQIAGANKNTVNINGGEVTGTRAVWIQLAGSDTAAAPEMELNVTDGVLTGTKVDSSDNKLAVYSYSYGNNMGNVAVNISGGTFNGDVALTGGKNKTAIETVSITGGTFTGRWGEVYSYGDDALAAEAISITGGTFATDAAAFYAADDGYVFVENANGTYGVEKAKIATIYDAHGREQGTYTDLQTAIDSTYAGDIVKILTDAKIAETVTVGADKDMTLELNGCEVKLPGILNYGTLTIRNGTLTGTEVVDTIKTVSGSSLTLTDVTATGLRHIVRVDGEDNAKVTAVINSGSYTVTGTSGTRHALNVSGDAEVVVKSGTFVGPKGTTCDSGSAVCVQNGAVVTIEGGNFSKGKNATLGVSGTLTVHGGVYDQDPTAYVAEGYAALPDLNDQYIVGVKPTATINNLGAKTIPAGDYMVYGGGTNTEDMPLSFVMQFLADQDAEDMATSPYAEWYGDFVITFTGIENGSFTADGCYLAGFYGDFGWVKVPVDGMRIKEGARYPVMLGVGMGQKYEYICSGVKDFLCALYLSEDILLANPNLQVNLELSIVDASKGGDAAANALVEKEGIYEVADREYTAEDFVVSVAKVGENYYTTLAEAVAAAKDGDTVTLLADANGDGIIIDKDVTIDLGGYTYTIDGTLVGSTGTKSCGFQILSGNTVAIKNGAIVVDEAAVRGHDGKTGNNFAIQNYADLTLENVSVKGNSKTSYVVSINSGAVAMNGNTSIEGNDVAFDVCKYASYEVPVVTVNTTGTIKGKIVADGGTLKLEAADIEGELVYNSGSVTKAESVELTAPEGYEWVDGVLTEKEEEPTSKVVAKSYSLSLEGVVFMNVYFTVEGYTASNAADIQENVGMYVWDKKDYTGDPLTSDLALADKCPATAKVWNSSNSEYRYMAQTEGIAAAKLGDDLIMVPYAEIDGVTYLAEKPVDKSPRVYAESNIPKASTDAAMKNVLISLMNYGAATQQKFGYKTDSLMNDFLDADQKVLGLSSVVYTPRLEVDTAKVDAALTRSALVTSRTASLSLEGAINVNYYFKYNGTAVDAKLLFWKQETYTADGAVLTEANADLTVDLEQLADGRYYGDYKNIAAAHMGKTLFCCAVFTNAAGETAYSGVISYSPMHYANNNKANADTALATMMQYMAVYGNYANIKWPG